MPAPCRTERKHLSGHAQRTTVTASDKEVAQKRRQCLHTGLCNPAPAPAPTCKEAGKQARSRLHCLLATRPAAHPSQRAASAPARPRNKHGLLRSAASLAGCVPNVPCMHRVAFPAGLSRERLPVSNLVLVKVLGWAPGARWQAASGQVRSRHARRMIMCHASCNQPATSSRTGARAWGCGGWMPPPVRGRWAHCFASRIRLGGLESF